ncbi:hypothetical protein ACET3X_009084 [Alternaria dauci]|uniref:Rhodopsin domain-containing protein n=1 Tax=Alternaria dauci TaxID=48095 RepID=A0ABR3U7T1_9PLEO
MSNVNGVITAIPPPDGYEVNFANPRRRLLTEAYVIFTVENILAFVFLGQRLYTKIRLMKQFQIDDAFVIFGWACSVGTQGILITGFSTGSMGVHAWEIPIEKYAFYSRITLCIFYSRLSPFVAFQWAVWITAFICASSYIAIFFSLLFACKPIAASWDPLLLPTATCVNRGAIYIATAVIGIITDVMLISIPIPTIWGLQMPTKQKIGLTLMFGVGSITMVTSVIRLVVLIPALTDMDQTWIIAVGSMWIIIESNLFIICCCLPTVRRFLKHVAPRLIGESRSSENKDSSDRNHGLRTWGSENTGPKRKYDTLMRTVEGTTQGDGDDEIPLASVPNKEGFRDREHKVPIGNAEIKGDNDSEEAILYERTVQVTYDGGAGGNPANMYTRQIWAGGQPKPTNL